MLLSTYCDMILSVKLGFRGGKEAISKPLYIFCIIKAIDMNVLKENKIEYDNIFIHALFGALYCRYNGIDEKKFLTPAFYIRPFYHLGSSSFYHLIWKDKVCPPLKSNTPSAKYLKENLLYAKLDDDLWTLLQKVENREYIKTKIKERFKPIADLWQQDTMTS